MTTPPIIQKVPNWLGSVYQNDWYANFSDQHPVIQLCRWIRPKCNYKHLPQVLHHWPRWAARYDRSISHSKIEPHTPSDYIRVNVTVWRKIYSTITWLQFLIHPQWTWSVWHLYQGPIYQRDSKRHTPNQPTSKSQGAKISWPKCLSCRSI